MGNEVVVIYTHEEPPADWHAAVFLAGPTPRTPEVASWRPAALEALRDQWSGAGRLVVFVPEDREPEHRDKAHDEYMGQIGWEERCLNLADEVLFWVPRDLTDLPAFTTNVEWGMWHDSGRVVFGAPPEAPKNRYLLHYAVKHGVPTATTLAGAVAEALAKIGAGSYREGGEREVPLLLWRTETFQQWYGAQRGAGNTLRAARPVWREGNHWGLHVAVHIAAEDRVKDNEVVFSRPDISVVVLYRPGPAPEDTLVVLVREFRSPVATVDGFVHELPGGSGPGEPLQNAVAEVAEETGLVLAPERLRAHGARQVIATMSAHRAHLFSAEITDAEVAALRRAGPQGVAAAGERTYVEIAAYGEIRKTGLADWATLGALAQVLCEGGRYV